MCIAQIEHHRNIDHQRADQSQKQHPEKRALIARHAVKNFGTLRQSRHKQHPAQRVGSRTHGNSPRINGNSANELKSHIERRCGNTQVQRARLAHKTGKSEIDHNSDRYGDDQKTRRDPRLQKPGDDIGNANNQANHRGTIRKKLIRIIHIGIVIPGLPKNRLQVPPRSPKPPCHKHKKRAHTLPLHQGIAPSTALLVHAPKLKTGLPNKRNFAHQQKVEKPYRKKNFQIHKISKADRISINMRQQRRKKASKIKKPGIRTHTNAGNRRIKMSNNIPPDNPKSQPKTNPKKIAPKKDRPAASPRRIASLGNHLENRREQRIIQTLALNPLLAKNNHQTKTHHKPGQNKRNPPENRTHPHLPRNGHARWQTLVQKRGLAVFIGRKEIGRKIGLNIVNPPVLRRCQIIRRGHQPQPDTG